MAELRELRSITVPRMFWDLVMATGESIEKAILFYDFLVSDTQEGFQTGHLNSINEGPAKMAHDLFEWVYNSREAPFWFRSITKGIKLPDLD